MTHRSGGDGPIPGTGYALRQVVVAPDLHALRGPLSGRRQLPAHLDSSARAVLDFADNGVRLEPEAQPGCSGGACELH
jgi:hypothetical protein